MSDFFGRRPSIRLLFGLAQRSQLAALDSRVFLLQLIQFDEGIVPALFQCPGYQTILRVNHIVLAFGEPSLVAGSLQAQLPLPVEGLPLLF